ncbi:Ig-like domain-containing protein, partial [Pseudomonas protegens]|uniref:Ig-like domain-containing protein n=1 Tax=Pseudomonas protegens TaxID=380021 RepID=UPI003807DFE6
AKPDGSFKLTSKTPQPNGEFTTTVRDAAGNKGESVTGNYTDSNTDDTQAPEKATGLVTQTESDGKMTVNGNAEPGSTVEVKFPDGSTGTTVAKPDGSFKLTSKTPQPNGEFTTTVRDAAGNKGESVTGNYTASNTDDTQAPDSPTNLIAVPQADGTAKVTGKAESNSTVKVTLPDGTVQETKAGPDGNFTLVSATPQPNGKVSAVATDAAGNTSAPAQVDFTASNSIDNKAPDAPTGLVALELSDGKVTVSGKAEPNSTVTVTFADGSKGSVLAQANGDFTLTSAAAQNTAGTISAIAKDAAGNASPAATLPFVPAPAPDAPVFTDISTDPVTGLLTIKGTAPANMKVQLTFPDTTVKDVITSASGGFSFASNSPQDAAQFSAVTINEISGRFSAVTVGIYDGNPNAIYEVTVDGYIDAVPAVLWQQLTSKPTNDPKPTLVGKYQGGSAADQVVILENGVQIALATMDRGTKTWSARLPTVTDGVHNYTVEIRNPLGTSKASAATSLTIDTHAPDAPTIDNIRVVEQGSSQEILLSASGQTTDNTPTFSGRAEAGSTVIFYHLNADGQEAEIGRTIATAAGTWSHTSDFLTNRQQNIYAKAQDLASNISALSNTVAISVSGPTDKPQSIDVKYIWSVDSAGDVDGDGFDDVASGSYNYGNGSQLLRGILQGNADIASTPVKFYNFKDDWSYHQAGAGDTNGDGFNDVISMYGDRSGTSDGPSRLYLGGGISSVEGGWSNYTNLGLSRFVASAGDLDGDGLMDVVLGGSGAKGQNTKSSIRFGTTGDAATGTVLGNFSFGAAQKEANGSKDAAYSGAQYVTSAGDFNGDGIGDIVTAGGITFGRSTRGTLNREADIEWQTGSGARELNQAQAVSGVGDVNGDGYADVALQDGRNVFVVFGGTLASSTIRLETNWLKANNRGFALDTSWVSTQPTTYSDIRGVGDVNGDGLADFAYSTYGNDSFTGSNDRQGLADQAEFKFSNSYVIFGKTSTDTIDVKNMLPREGIVSPRDQADGASIAGRMDVNGDGLADVHVGSYNGAGKLYLGGASLGAEPSVLVGAYGRAFGDKKSNFIVGSAGRDYLVGNGGTDVIYAGAGNDIIVLNQDNLAHLAAGFDATAGINGRLARVDGGNGIDTLEFDKEVSTVDLTTISNAGLGTIQTGVGLSRLANIERVDLHGTNKAKLTLELKDVMDMNAGLSVFSKESFSSALADEAVKRHQLVIDGTSDNTVQIKGREDWITAKATTVDSNGHLYDVYNTVGENKGQLLIEQGVNVVWA